MRTTRIAISIARLLLGLVFTVFGLDGFLHFLPQPTTPPPEGAMAFAIALMALELALAWAYRAAYRPLLAPRDLERSRAWH